jgi:glutaredoxin 3
MLKRMSKLVDELIKTHKVVVFSKTYCPYCVKAKNVLTKYAIKDLYVIELENREDCDEMQNYLSKLTGARTVPRVFIDGKCIGGGDDTAKLDSQNKLKPLLLSCGAI